MSDPFEELIREQRLLEQTVERTRLKEIPIKDKGTFTPALVGSGTAGTFTYTANLTLVEWTRNGNRIEFNGRLVITAIAVAPVGNMTITGFPAGFSDSTMAIAGFCTFVQWQFNVAAGYTHVVGQFANGSTSMTILKNGDNLASTIVQGSEVALIGGGGTNIDLRFGGGYRCAA